MDSGGRLSLNQLSTFRWTFKEDVEFCCRAEVPSIGAWIRKILDWGEEEAIKFLLESGLNVTSLSWAGGFTGSDGRKLVESIDDSLEAVRLAAAVNSPCLFVHPGGRNNHLYRQAERILNEALEAILPLAEVLDVRIVIEPRDPMHAADFTFLTSLEAALNFSSRFPPERIGIVLDTYYFPSAEEWNVVFDQIDRLAIVQLAGRGPSSGTGEENRFPLATQQEILRAGIEQLEAGGYHGCYEIELHGPEWESEDYLPMLRSTVRDFRQLFA